MHASDTSFLEGPDTSAACSSATRTQSWTYDACERVTHENSHVGSKTKFTLDVQGTATQEVAGRSTITPTFAGQKLQSEDFSPGTSVTYATPSARSTVSHRSRDLTVLQQAVGGSVYGEAVALMCDGDNVPSDVVGPCQALRDVVIQGVAEDEEADLNDALSGIVDAYELDPGS